MIITQGNALHCGADFSVVNITEGCSAIDLLNSVYRTRGPNRSGRGGVHNPRRDAMSKHGSARVPRMVGGAVIATAVSALAISGAPPAVASQADSDAIADRRAPAAISPHDAAVQAALARDLGIAPTELDALADALAE